MFLQFRSINSNCAKKNKKLLHKLHLISSNLISIKKVCCRLADIQKKLVNTKNTLEIGSTYMLSLPKDKRLVYNYHQESNYLKEYEDILNIHFPIFNQSNLENGTMSVLSKTHTLGNLKYIKKRFSKNSFTDLIPIGIEKIKNKYEEIFFELNLRDVVFFHKYLIHKSNFNNTNKCRIVGIGRFTNAFKNLKNFEVTGKNGAPPQNL